MRTSALHHPPGVVGVEVEGGDQRLVPDELPDLGEDVPLDVVVVLADPGPVEVEGDAVDLPRLSDAFERAR